MAATVGGVADHSAIEWTESTWNPTTGCDRISSGCDHCYALTLAKRLKAMGNPKYQNDGNPKTSGPGFGVSIHLSALNLPKTWRKPRLVFVNSMSDLFHDRIPADFIQAVFDVMAETPRHTYQLLTKRPKRAARMAARGAITVPDNVWMGTTVEDEKTLWRIDELRKIEARTRFISAEPLLSSLSGINLERIHWLIAGGESGKGFRPVEGEWIRELRDACVDAKVGFFFKQWGGQTPKAGGRELDGRVWNEQPRYDGAAAPVLVNF